MCIKNYLFLGYKFSYVNVFIFPLAPHRDWLSHQRDQLRIGKNKNQGSELNHLQAFSKVHINIKLI